MEAESVLYNTTNCFLRMRMMVMEITSALSGTDCATSGTEGDGNSCMPTAAKNKVLCCVVLPYRGSAPIGLSLYGHKANH